MVVRRALGRPLTGSGGESESWYRLPDRGQVRVKVELVSYAIESRRLFGADPKDTPGSPSLMDRLKGPSSQDPPKSSPEDDVRTLWVDFDNQGERFKTWRDAVKESYVLNLEEKPIDGPLTALHTMKHMERHGGDARQWLLFWMRIKHIEQTDKVYHELKVLTDSLWYAATFDQLNVPALITCEILCKRIQDVVDAYSNPSKPSWENAGVFSGQGGPEDIVSPTFRS